MGFTPLDLHTWPRGQIFHYFAKLAPTGYSLTVELDVTALHRALKGRGQKFFPAYLWLVTKNLNRQPEFRIAERDGVLGCYDCLTPLYAVFHEEAGSFSLMWTGFREMFQDFYGSYLENQARFGACTGLLAQGEAPPESSYTVSCLPWVSFQAFSVHSYENKPYYFPSVEAGRFREAEGRILMPLSLTCHHAVTDGYHVSQFLEALQRDMDAPEAWL